MISSLLALGGPVASFFSAELAIAARMQRQRRSERGQDEVNGDTVEGRTNQQKGHVHWVRSSAVAADPERGAIRGRAAQRGAAAREREMDGIRGSKQHREN